MRDCKHLTFSQMEAIIHMCDERDKYHTKRINHLQTLIADLVRQRNLYRDNLVARIDGQTELINSLKQQVATVAIHTYQPIDIKA